MRRHQQELGPMSEMNVTNLLDTAFVLLIAFMMVAPTIKHGIQIDLPVVKAGSIEGDKKKTLTIVLQKKSTDAGTDRIYIEDKRLTIPELTAEVQKQKKLYPEMDVVVEGDRAVTLETLLQVVATLQSIGIENVGFPTKPIDLTEKR